MEIVSKGRERRRRRSVLGPGLPLAILIGFIAFTLATARPGDPALYPARGDAVTIHLLDNGFHTDLVLPRDQVLLHHGPMARAAAGATDMPFIAIGWGDAKFYTESGASFARALDGLRALFAPGNPSLLRVFGVSQDPALAYPGSIRTIRLSPQGFRALLDRMDRSLGPGVREAVAVEAGYDPRHRYFRSAEPFSLLRLCNHWSSDMLDAAGVPTIPATDGIAPLFLLSLSWRAGISPPR